MEHVGSSRRAARLEGGGPRRRRSACHQRLSHAYADTSAIVEPQGW